MLQELNKLFDVMIFVLIALYLKQRPLIGRGQMMYGSLRL